MKAIAFEIKSNFGFFQWGKTKGDRRFSTSFLSKTEVLGILGSIIGLEGYPQINFKKKNKAETGVSFYEGLSGLNVSIVPQTHPRFFEDHMIHRHMDEINKRGALMVKMAVLTKPSFKIVASQGEVDDEYYEKLVHYLKTEQSEYIPYLGKNQFPLEIENVKEVNLEQVDSNDEHVIHSLVREEDVDLPRIRERHLKESEFHYSEELKFFDEEMPEIERKTCVWSSYGMRIAKDVYQDEEQNKMVFL